MRPSGSLQSKGFLYYLGQNYEKINNYIIISHNKFKILEDTQLLSLFKSKRNDPAISA